MPSIYVYVCHFCRCVLVFALPLYVQRSVYTSFFYFSVLCIWNIVHCIVLTYSILMLNEGLAFILQKICHRLVIFCSSKYYQKAIVNNILWGFHWHNIQKENRHAAEYFEKWEWLLSKNCCFLLRTVSAFTVAVKANIDIMFRIY